MSVGRGSYSERYRLEGLRRRVLSCRRWSIEVKDRRGFDGEDGDVGQWRDATVAYEGRLGEVELLGGLFGGGRKKGSGSSGFC